MISSNASVIPSANSPPGATFPAGNVSFETNDRRYTLIKNGLFAVRLFACISGNAAVVRLAGGYSYHMKFARLGLRAVRLIVAGRPLWIASKLALATTGVGAVWLAASVLGEMAATGLYRKYFNPSGDPEDLQLLPGNPEFERAIMDISGLQSGGSPGGLTVTELDIDNYPLSLGQANQSIGANKIHMFSSYASAGETRAVNSGFRLYGPFPAKANVLRSYAGDLSAVSRLVVRMISELKMNATKIGTAILALIKTRGSLPELFEPGERHWVVRGRTVAKPWCAAFASRLLMRIGAFHKEEWSSTKLCHSLHNTSRAEMAEAKFFVYTSKTSREVSAFHTCLPLAYMELKGRMVIMSLHGNYSGQYGVTVTSHDINPVITNIGK